MSSLSFARLAAREGIGHVRLHDLRHFVATTMLVNGVDVRTTAGRLGHAQSSTTLNVYALAIAEEELPSDAFVFSHRPDGAAPWYPNYATLEVDVPPAEGAQLSASRTGRSSQSATRIAAA